VFRKILLSPESGSSSTTGTAIASWQLTIPGFSPQVAAQAQAWFLAWSRTIRGKMAWIVPPLFLFFMNVLWADALMAKLPKWIVLVKGPMLAQAGLLLAFLTLQPMLLNQFAIDGPGLSGTFTYPVTRRQILRGKQTALAMILFPSILLVVGLSNILGRDGSVWTWLAILLNSVAVFLIMGTLGSLFSILFPRKADLMAIGKASNPHPVAGVVGTVATAVLLGPGTGMSLATWTGMPAWTPTAVLALWVALTWAGSRVLENMTVDALERRQEMILALTRGT
jgi:hypothetical protein